MAVAGKASLPATAAPRNSAADRSPPSPVAEAARRWALAAIAACVAESVTHPSDFTKTRMQLANELGRSSPVAAPPPAVAARAPTRALGMLATFRHVWRTEGLLAMYQGLPAAALRQAVYGGIGVGLYAPVRALVIGDQDPKDAPVYKRIAAGMLTGGVGQLVASPTDVVKVRLQADGRLRLLGQTPRYRGTLDAFTRIPREEGIAGFYKVSLESVRGRGAHRSRGAYARV